MFEGNVSHPQWSEVSGYDIISWWIADLDLEGGYERSA
jgi:hypothetical protein